MAKALSGIVEFWEMLDLEGHIQAAQSMFRMCC